MKKIIYLFVLIGVLIIISGCTSVSKSVEKESDEKVAATTENEIHAVQIKLDEYLAKYPKLKGASDSSADCYLYDDATAIILKCPFGTIQQINQTNDNVSFSYESSGGSKSKWSIIIPHFEPIQKSENLKLVREGPDYLFECNPNAFHSNEEKKVPYTIVTSFEAEKYVKVSKQRCAGYQTEYIQSQCLNCLVNIMYSLNQSPNVSYCDDFEQYPDLYGKCLGNVASRSSDITICDGGTDVLIKDNCYYIYARGQRNASPCSNIMDADLKDSCTVLITEREASVGIRNQ
jgi:hypothetical protein